MDQLDIEIIEILTNDARIPFSKMAKNLNVGIDTIMRRYDKLLKTGIIEPPTLVIDARLAGFRGLIDFLVKLKPGTSATEARAQLRKLDGILGVAITLGDIDLYFSLFFRDIDHLVDVTKSLKQIKEISQIEPLLYPTQWTIPIISSNLAGKKVKQKSIIRSLFSTSGKRVLRRKASQRIAEV
jgi:Lrp/AsnC family transcriptional regulator, regulator for asnA, asnC and gidA